MMLQEFGQPAGSGEAAGAGGTADATGNVIQPGFENGIRWAVSGTRIGVRPPGSRPYSID